MRLDDITPNDKGEEKKEYLRPMVTVVTLGLQDEILEEILISQSAEGDDDKVKGEVIWADEDGSSFEPVNTDIWDDEW